MYIFYNLAMTLALAVVVPVYFVRRRLRRGEALHLKERLGFVLPVPKGGRPFVWIHAVSVGEVLSLQSLVRRIRETRPDWEIGFSVLTHSGYKMALGKIKDADHIFFLPFDLDWSVRRIFSRLKPSLLVLAESEYWPRLLKETGRRGCPVLVVNGRVSFRTFKRMRRLRFPARRLLSAVSCFLVQTPLDRERLEEIGVPSGKIQVAGNLKCETRLPELTAAEITADKTALGIPEGDKVIVAGSVHPGEGQTLIEAFRTARRRHPGIRLVLAPRHPEKFADLPGDPSLAEFAIQKKTGLDPSRPWDILLLDTIGELARVYAACDVAFIGGSLVPWGGQNLLEPAFYGKPIIFGPHMHNFAALAETFELGGGAKTVRTAEEIAAYFAFEDPVGMKEMGRTSREILLSLQGATERALQAMESMMAGQNV
ncbi:MAG: 3-deoxy-D-manno-octulosonic acid transferase [Candidatus Aminicenantales bacterium]